MAILHVLRRLSRGRLRLSCNDTQFCLSERPLERANWRVVSAPFAAFLVSALRDKPKPGPLRSGQVMSHQM